MGLSIFIKICANIFIWLLNGSFRWSKWQYIDLINNVLVTNSQTHDLITRLIRIEGEITLWILHKVKILSTCQFCKLLLRNYLTFSSDAFCKLKISAWLWIISLNQFRDPYLTPSRRFLPACLLNWQNIVFFSKKRAFDLIALWFSMWRPFALHEILPSFCRS